MQDIRQSPAFASFMKDLGWKVEKTGNIKIFIRTFPVIGSFAKIPRAGQIIPGKIIIPLRRKFRIFSLNISPAIITGQRGYQDVKQELSRTGFRINRFPFNPTTTILIDLKQKQESIFNSFSQAKRRAVRRSEKNGVTVRISDDIGTFIRIRQKQYFPAGFLVPKEMKILWKNFFPHKSTLLLAYSPDQKPVGGILLLYHDRIAYYWYASALKEGKKLFAPTLLVWKALKKAKKQGCVLFDFEGICDDRFPEASKSWKGFTRFKEGFGGRKAVFMENMNC